MLDVYLGNFESEISRTLLAKHLMDRECSSPRQRVTGDNSGDAVMPL